MEVVMKRRDKKRFCQVLLSAFVMLSLVGCGGGGADGSPQVPDAVPVVLGQPGSSDAGNHFPFAVGNFWSFRVTSVETGLLQQSFVNTVSITGTRQVDGVTTSVFRDTNPAGTNVPEDDFLARDPNGIANLGSDDPTDIVTPQFGPYWELRFPLEPGSSFVALDRKGLDLGEDIDRDGINELLDFRLVTQVAGFEQVTVPVGTFPDCAKIEQNAEITYIFSRDGSRVASTGVLTLWFAPDLGWVKRMVVTAIPSLGFSKMVVEELIGFSVDGQSQQINIQVAPATGALNVGSTLQLTVAAYNPSGGPVEAPSLGWSSSNPAVVTVDANGRVQGISSGSAFITASLVQGPFNLGSNQVTVNVGSGTVIDVRQIALATNDLLLDPFVQKIYASVPSRAGANGNSVAVINPDTGQVESFIPVGGEPKKLAISDDGRFLYVAQDGAGSVVRLNLNNSADPVIDLTFSLGSDPYWGPIGVEDMEVMPAAPQSVAISRKVSGPSVGHRGVAIFDDGVQRPVMTPELFGNNAIEFSAIPGVLYGYNNETTDWGFRRLGVDEDGVTILTEDSYSTGNPLISGFGVDIAYAGGLLFATSGRVIDPEARLILGTIPEISSVFWEYGPKTQVEPDVSTGRVFFLSSHSLGQAPRRLSAYDSRTLAPLGSENIPAFAGVPLNLIRWGSNGLAFGTTGDQVVLVRTNLVP